MHVGELREMIETVREKMNTGIESVWRQYRYKKKKMELEYFRKKDLLLKNDNIKKKKPHARRGKNS